MAEPESGMDGILDEGSFQGPDGAHLEQVAAHNEGQELGITGYTWQTQGKNKGQIRYRFTA